MLVLTRRFDESIKIGDLIEIKVIEIKGNSVKLGLEAPGDVKIIRKELIECGLESTPASREPLR